MTYVFDEPSIGLHDSEQDKLLEVLHSLVENGNSLIVVEHDEKTIRTADHLIDIGPDAGTQGGELVFCDTIEELLNPANEIDNSHTQNWLSGRDNISSKKLPLSDENKSFWLKNASRNNLKSITVEFKSKALNVICGVSGAGKSSLVESLIEKSIIPKTHGAEIFSQHVFIDQSPIGRTPRSNPATYTKVFDLIRKLFGELADSKSKGWDKSRFSFNVKGGRCEECEGAGYQQIGMHFLGNVDVICQHCNGKRFNAETLAVKYHSQSINDVLEMTIDEACLFFEDQKAILKILQTMQELGLGYIGLGQSSTTLSGGEAQRIKLASELWKSSKGQTLYILDEPTTGLHHKDVKALIRSLQSLVNNGHTVITIEHHAEMLKAANYLVELGPGSGTQGGELVFSGSPEQLINENKTLTAKALQLSHQSISRKERKAFEADFIKLKNVSTHNLKNIDVDIPLGKMTVITGVSGSGKSSLAFDTLYAEGQRRFLESVSTYARTLMKSMDKPDVEEIQNLNPVVAIGQRNSNTNARSTVGTLSEVYDYYRLLYSRIGYIICPKCNAKAVNGICVCGWKVENKATASHFSFNHESGACPVCKGLGTLTVCDQEELISHPNKSIFQGAMDGHKSGKFYGDFHGQYVAILQSISKENSIDFAKPWDELDENAKQIVLFGTGEKDYKVDWHYKRKNMEGVEKFTGKWVGFCHLVNAEYQRKHADKRADAMLPIMKEIKCSSCNGSRLNKQSFEYLFQGVDIAELSSKTINESILFFSQIDQDKLDSTSQIVLNDILPPVLHKLNMISKAGLSYLNINRTISTLSGGESQRLRLASSLGTGLCGITYILDEPTVGLHPRDTQNLIAILQELKKQDNTLVIVEHDEDVIQAADHVIKLGPSAGNFGGQVQYAGKPEASLQTIKKESKTLKLDFNIKIQKANANNLKDFDVELPSNGMTVFTGVSGSGKTSLLFSVLADSAAQGKAINCQQISGLEQFDSIIPVTHYQVSNHPSSIVATFTGIFDDIRKLFADTDEAKKMNLSKSHFSFNNKAGYCDNCQGLGQTKISMDFLADVWSVCEECRGRRYNYQVQSVKLKGKSISDVLDMSIDSAKDYFEDRSLKGKIGLLQQTGLGYLKVGQTTRTLSGGESQRLKLASDIINGKGNKNLYLFDEPTKGLHREDIDVLLQLFNKLIAQGHCLYIIEHNLQVIIQADWVVDLGLEGGDEGGEIVFQGLLADLIKCDESYTGLHVKQAI
ncbi:MAG: ATP-binding cassette domain-containing protein [Bacteroidetes bacterium]|nr:ATP-binding cassette domain-containing protein [Bacteroidota bacterium]MBT7038933.1 ATP-binding cassette domain-containing protein [Bacteroidota bacterium]